MRWLFGLAALLALMSTASAQQIGGGGSGGVSVGAPIGGTCPNGYFVYSNSGYVGCTSSSSSLSIGTAITGSTAGYGLYVTASNQLGQFQYGTGVYSALAIALNNGTTGLVTGSGLASPPAIGGTTPAAGSFSSLKDTGITGSTQCLHADTSGNITGTGSDCGSGGGAVASVSNSDGTVVVSPTTGAVVVSASSFTNAMNALTALSIVGSF